MVFFVVSLVCNVSDRRSKNVHILYISYSMIHTHWLLLARFGLFRANRPTLKGLLQIIIECFDSVLYSFYFIDEVFQGILYRINLYRNKSLFLDILRPFHSFVFKVLLPIFGASHPRDMSSLGHPILRASHLKGIPFKGHPI